MKKFLAALALGTSAVVSLNATAGVDLNGTFSGAGGLASFGGGGNLNTATSLTFDGLWAVTPPIPPTYRGDPNLFLTNADFIAGADGSVPASLNVVGFTPVNDLLVWAQGANATNPVNRFHFNALTLSQDPSTPNFLNLNIEGIFHDDKGVYNDGAASMLMTAQNLNGTLSYSFSWGAPPFSNPAPGVLWLMGAGLMGLLAARRRGRT